MTSTVDVIIPSEQREGTQSAVGRWLKQVGDTVSENEPLVEINTDKVTLEVAAPASGVLSEILKAEKDEIELNDILGRITVGAAASKISPGSNVRPFPESKTKAGDGERHSPAVLALATKHKVDLKGIAGTGKGGRITALDVEKAALRVVVSPHASVSGGKRVPHTPMRRKIAQHMVESVSTAPHVTTVFEADLTAVLADKKKQTDAFAKKGVKLTLTAYIVRAAVKALADVPEVKSRWHEDSLEIIDEINIGIATAVESSQGGGAGLVVPVLKAAGSQDLFELANSLQALAERARAGELSKADLSNATFSISNHGMGGSLFAAPIIIPQPQSAILGVGKVEKRVAVEEINGKEQMVIRPSAYVTLTIDHRALDGFTANAYLRAFCSYLQRI